MAKNIQDLRREKGYKSAREFAEALGIPTSTYARYESQPDGIPLKQAWAIADKLGCTIDMVVGRDTSNFADLRGEVQQFYDDLSISSRSLFREFMDFTAQREERVQERRRMEKERRAISTARFYEQMFMQSLYENEDPDAIIIFDSRDEMREAFRDFLQKAVPNRRFISADNEARRRFSSNRQHLEEMGRKVEKLTPEEEEERIDSLIEQRLRMIEQREGTVEEVIEEILEAYDKLHSGDESDEPSFRYRF